VQTPETLATLTVSAVSVMAKWIWKHLSSTW